MPGDGPDTSTDALDQQETNRVLYEYRHNAKRKRGCPKTFELIRNISARDDAAECPKCGSKDTERLKFQAFAIAGSTDPDIFGGDGEADDFDDIGDDFGF